MGTALGLSVPNPCTQVPAAAKTAPAPPTTIREQLQAKPKQEKDHGAKDKRLPNDANTYLKRLADGELRANEETKAEAVAALSVFRSLSDKKQKLDFSKDPRESQELGMDKNVVPTIPGDQHYKGDNDFWHDDTDS